MGFFSEGVQSVDAKSGKETLWDLESKINQAVFPGLQVISKKLVKYYKNQ